MGRVTNSTKQLLLRSVAEDDFWPCGGGVMEGQGKATGNGAGTPLVF